MDKMTDIEQLKYPIGKFQKPANFDKSLLESYISVIKNFPEKLKNEVKNLNDQQLDTTYRTDGWTIRQVVNHCADSHINSFVRFKLSLTEDKPTIKPYFEEKWAELSDSKSFPIDSSLKILEGIHIRWTNLLENMADEDFEKSFIHPEHGKEFKLNTNLGIYAWHCEHHLAHITSLKKRMNW
jgi:hypothetical protein